ncbi:hypothetical protein T4C_12037 [Trichinella pseudospiralis]|uniref:Uncharacterized protein n=1 Tax=Trichinella pseudospiralis TaxID=6337 RepID=A0A0V1GEN4_TRIPS|nr:hypothetical protein T4C_12037 [Trichinella pseudospiralis]
MKDQKAFACVLQIFVNWNQTTTVYWNFLKQIQPWKNEKK